MTLQQMVKVRVKTEAHTTETKTESHTTETKTRAAEVHVKVHAQIESKIRVITSAKTKSKDYIKIYTMSYSNAYADAYIGPYKKAYGKSYAEVIDKAYTKYHTASKAAGMSYLVVSKMAGPEANMVAQSQAHNIADTSGRAVADADYGVVAKAEAHARAEILTFLHKFATDCLRLSMYFFHPIQQCAEQVYHSALPLSPTSSQLQKSSPQIAMNNQQSHIIAFSGAPSTWGPLLRTIDVRPRQPTCITASGQKIISACENVVNIYDAVTGVPQQTLCAPETVIKLQASLDGSTLFFAHSFSVAMWDVQTGGLIHTFNTPSKINSIAVSMTHIACGSCNGSITFWNVHTKEQGKHLRIHQPVITIDWLSSLKLAFATQNSVHICDFALGTSRSLSIPGQVWGVVCLVDKDELLVGTSWQTFGVDQRSFFMTIGHKQQCELEPQGLKLLPRQSTEYKGLLMSPILVDRDVVCITPTDGVQLFNTHFNNWTNHPPLLAGATSVVRSLNRNIVVQTKGSIQIFSLDVLTSDNVCTNKHPSHIYPLGKNDVICVFQSTKQLTLLELETLQELNPDDSISPLRSLSMDQLAPTHASFCHGLVAEFGVSAVIQAWRSGAPLHRWTDAAGNNVTLSRLSPECTHITMVYNSPQYQELCVKDIKDGATLAKLPLKCDKLELGEVYDLIFESETRFYLKIDSSAQHIQIPYDIIASPSGCYSHTIAKGGSPVILSEPRLAPPYTLDANCEWVLDAESRKICWVSPENLRRAKGSHFWVGLSLVMVGGDGVVRKLTFKEPVRGRGGRGRGHDQTRQRSRRHALTERDVRRGAQR